MIHIPSVQLTERQMKMRQGKTLTSKDTLRARRSAMFEHMQKRKNLPMSRVASGITHSFREPRPVSLAVPPQSDAPAPPPTPEQRVEEADRAEVLAKELTLKDHLLPHIE